MKQNRQSNILLITLLLIILTWTTVWTETTVAATNSVQGGVGGVNNGTIQGGDGNVSAQITINSTQLALVKEARDGSGAVINGTDVTSGQVVYFVISVDNTTPFSAVDVRITDALNEAEFTYVADSIETIAVGTGTDLATVWAAGWTTLSDNVGGPDDVASCTDTGGAADRDRLTIGQVAVQANQQLDIAGSTLWALRIRVTIN